MESIRNIIHNFNYNNAYDYFFSNGNFSLKLVLIVIICLFLLLKYITNSLIWLFSFRSTNPAITNNINTTNSTKNESTNQKFSITYNNITTKQSYKDIYNPSEQFKNPTSLFKKKGMNAIENSFIIIVGIGGVGSHALMTLVRSGVRKIRIIDYDVVTLSSLNRHAFAFREDVGKMKVDVCRKYIEKINPNIELECIDDAFTFPDAESYIAKGNPDYVIDCIDDLDAKIELLYFCNINSIKVISSMGAGAKKDPTTIRISDLANIQGDKMARRIKYAYKKKYNMEIPKIILIYSEEKTEMGLSDLEHHQKDNPEDYRINENERVRSLPVFASLPAIFGQSIAAVILTDIAGIPIKTINTEKDINGITKIDVDTGISIKKDKKKDKETNEGVKKEVNDLKETKVIKPKNILKDDKENKSKKEITNVSDIDLMIKKFIKHESKINHTKTDMIKSEDYLKIYNHFGGKSSISYGIEIDKEIVNEKVKEKEKVKEINEISSDKDKVIDKINDKSKDKLIFIRWNLKKEISRNNIILINNQEWANHLKLKSEEELKEFYGDSKFNEIEKSLLLI